MPRASPGEHVPPGSPAITPTEHRKFIIRFKKAYRAGAEHASRVHGAHFSYRTSVRPGPDGKGSPFGEVLRAIRHSGAYDWAAVLPHYSRASGMALLAPAAEKDNDAMINAAIARVAVASATGDLSRVHPEERDLARAMLHALKSPIPDFPEPPAAATAAPAPGGVAVVDAAFAWRRRARVGAAAGLVLTSVPIAIPAIASEDAPIAFRLRRPDGGKLDIRRRGEVWLRPVLAPGSWAPVSFARFAQALATGEAHRDSPLRRLGREDGPPNAGVHRVRSLAWLEDHAMPGAPANEQDAESERRTSEDATALCADLVVIDGGVWTPTPEPRVRVAARIGNDGDACDRNLRIVATWRCGDLHGTDPQDILCPRRDVLPLRCAFPLPNYEDRPVRPWVEMPEIDLPISRWETAARIATAVSGGEWTAPGPLAESVEDAKLPTSGSDLVDAVRALLASAPGAPGRERERREAALARLASAWEMRGPEAAARARDALLASAPKAIAQSLAGREPDWTTRRLTEAWLAALTETASAAVEACLSPETDLDAELLRTAFAV